MKSNKGKTPSELGINKGTYVGPEGGWKPQTYYVAETASTLNNAIHKVIFYSGFLGKNRRGELFPCGYNCILSPTYENSNVGIANTYYLKVLSEIDINLND